MIAAQIAPAITGVRLSLHVLAATVWVGGQLTVAGLLPAVRRLGEDATRRIAYAFARLSWPAYAILVATGIWNVTASSGRQGSAWQALLAAKVAVVVVDGGRAGGRRAGGRRPITSRHASMHVDVARRAQPAMNPLHVRRVVLHLVQPGTGG